MVILAKVVPYGGNSTRYALEKEKAQLVKINHMPEGLSATDIWYMMKHHCQLHEADRTVGRKLERYMVTFVVSPSKEEAANFTMDDWARLQDEALEALDSIWLIPEHMTKEVKTNLSNSMNVGGLHSDSKSGTLHLHIDCCRVDLDGNTNDVHDIHVRAMLAAEIINRNHGWEQPQEIRDMRHQQLARICEDTLRNMERFDTVKYFNALRLKGCQVKERFDNSGQLVGYSVAIGASIFTASQIGRKFTAKHLFDTWKKLHPKPKQVKPKPQQKPGVYDVTPIQPKVIGSKPSESRLLIRAVQEMAAREKPKPFTTFGIDIGTETKFVQVPTSIKDVFADEAQIPEGNETASSKNIANVALLLFAEYIDAATTMSEACGGGGGSKPESGWGKKDDEDDLAYARRCLRMAHSMCKPRLRYRRGR